jgi:heterodisulfide reductase subunit C
MNEVLFRLSDLTQEVQNIIIKLTFTFKHPIHLTRKLSAVIDCGKCFVAHDSPAQLTA